MPIDTYKGLCLGTANREAGEGQIESIRGAVYESAWENVWRLIYFGDLQSLETLGKIEETRMMWTQYGQAPKTLAIARTFALLRKSGDRDLTGSDPLYAHTKLCMS